jgi:hypothetical protein
MKKFTTKFMLIALIGFLVNNLFAQDVPGANIILNPSFDVNANGWSTYRDYSWSSGNANEALATFSVAPQVGFTGNAYTAAITKGGLYTYSVQVSYPVSIIAGKRYSITFKASAATNRQVQVVMQGSSDYWYGSPSINLTTTPTTYGPYFYTATTSDSTNRFRFYLGGTAGAVTTYIDDVEVAEMVPAGNTVPTAPSITSATAGNTRAEVSFTAPTSNGGLPISSYRVTSSPGGITATGTTSPIVVQGLTNGTAYTFTVEAINGVGPSPASAPSSIVTPVFMTTIYYVSPTGNISNSGSRNSPWTVQHASNQTVAGDIIYFLDGTYDFTGLAISRSGSTQGFITYAAEPGAKPILQCQNPCEIWDGITIRANYIKIEGLELIGNNANITQTFAEDYYAKAVAKETGFNFARINTNGISIGNVKNSDGTYSTTVIPHHIEVKNCKVHDFAGAGLAGINADYLLFENNEIYNNSWFTFYGTSAITVLQLRGNGTCVYRGNKVYNNECRIKWLEKGDYSDGNGIYVDVNKLYNGSFLIENNLAYNNGGRGLYFMSAKNGVIRNNTSYWNSKSSFSTGGEMVCWDSSNVTWVNNVAWANPAYSSNNYALNDSGAWGNNSNITWKNNITFNGTVGNPSTFFNKTTTTSVDSTNKLGVNPMFVNTSINPAVADFKLQSGSPAVNVGTSTLGISAMDIENTARVQAGIVDLGAYESQYTLGLGDINNLNSAFMVYPNPVKNELNILNPNAIEIKKVEIYTIDGKVIQSQTNIESGLNVINTEKLSTGIYLLKIKTSEKEYFQKIVKE